MSPTKTPEHCPTCASPNILAAGERNKGNIRELRYECVCGEAWWQQATEQPSQIDPWINNLEQNMRELQNDPDRVHELTKRGF